MPELIFSQEFSFVQLKNNLKMLNLYLEKAFADIHEQLYSYLWITQNLQENIHVFHAFKEHCHSRCFVNGMIFFQSIF